MAHFKSSLNSSFWDSFDTTEDSELNQRLGLYQLFLRLYNQNRGLLDEILSLETSESRQLTGIKLPYLQGLVLEQQVYLLTNLTKGKTQILSQPQHVWTIGRDPRKVGLAVQNNRLSRLHAAIQYVQGQGFQLVDLGSSNGSFINGELVKQVVLLKDGDQIRLGSLAFTFFVCDTAQDLNALSPECLLQLKEHELEPDRGDRTTAQPKNGIPTSPSSNSSLTSVEDTLHFMRDQKY